jgi:hypothetical protein
VLRSKTMETLGSLYGMCPCGADYEPRLVTVRFGDTGPEEQLQDVPQGVCPACGSHVFKADQLEAMEAAFRALPVTA